MKILYMIDEMEELTAGGTERQFLHMANVCREAGFDTHILVLRGTEWLKAEHCGCAVRHGNLRQIFSVSGIRELAQIVKWMRAERFHVVQGFFAETNLLAPVLGWLAGVPVRVGSRRNEGSWMSPRFARLQQISNWFVTRLQANSEGVRLAIARCERTSAAKIDVLYNGVNTAKFRPDPRRKASVRQELGIAPDDIVVGSSSNFVAVKRLDVLLEAAACVFRECPNTRFVLVGDGPERGRLEELRDKLGMSDRVRLLGRVDDVPSVLNACDIFVLCSSHEGFSNGLLEAMATGLACVATDVGGNREALGECGVLVSPRDAKNLADEIIGLAQNPDRRQQMGALARQRSVTHFSAVESDKQLVDYYRVLLNAVEGSRTPKVQDVVEPSAQLR